MPSFVHSAIVSFQVGEQAKLRHGKRQARCDAAGGRGV